jgi:hypothetical protein
MIVHRLGHAGLGRLLVAADADGKACLLKLGRHGFRGGRLRRVDRRENGGGG